MPVAQENSFYKCVIDIDDAILDSEKVFEVSHGLEVFCWYHVIVQKVLLRIVIVVIVQECTIDEKFTCLDIGKKKKVVNIKCFISVKSRLNAYSCRYPCTD